MAGATELPELVKEFTDMSKEYLLQETVEPAKQLGRYAGFGLGAAVAWAVGMLFLGIAGLRFIIDLLPDGPNWTALGYVVTVVALGILAGIIVGVAGRDQAGKD